MGNWSRILNVYLAQESIPRNEFRQPMSPGGRYDNPIPPRFLAPIDSLQIPAPGLVLLVKIRNNSPIRRDNAYL
jgi:hypothetical protein